MQLVKKIMLAIALAISFTGSAAAMDLSYKLKVLEVPGSRWSKVSNAAQNDLKNLIKVAHGLTIREARLMAEEDPEITFFVYVKSRYGGRW